MKLETRQRKMLDQMLEKGLMSEQEHRDMVEQLDLAEAKSAEEQTLCDECSREAESLLALIERQEFFAAKICKQCRRPFAANFAQVGYCSDRCRRAHLDSIGIPWDYRKTPEERWTAGFGKVSDKKVPLVVPPEALIAARENPAVQQFIVEAMLQLTVSDADQKVA